MPIAEWWEGARFGDGYDSMTTAQEHGWRVIPSWGPEGEDLGQWPYAWVAVRNHRKSFEVALYVEGDGKEWRVPTLEIRDALITALQAEWARV